MPPRVLPRLNSRLFPPAAFPLDKTGSGSSHHVSSHWSNLGQSPTCPMADAHDRRTSGWGGRAVFANLTLSGGWLVEKGSRSSAHFRWPAPPTFVAKGGANSEIVAKCFLKSSWSDLFFFCNFISASIRLLHTSSSNALVPFWGKPA